MSIPTDRNVTDAHNYAMSKLCTEIPTYYSKPGLTRWDNAKKKCRITEYGCNPSIDNPISHPMFTSSGEEIDYRGGGPFAEFWSRYDPEFLVMKTTRKSPQRKICSRGNFLLWQWCQIPRSRNDEEERGVTDTPRFQYNIRNGKEECYIPREYCDSKGVSYNEEERDCYVPLGQKVAEFFTGSVMVREARRASDRRLKENIRLVCKDFPVKGINLYTYKWNDIATAVYGLTGEDVGFMADELEPKHTYLDPAGFKHINTDADDDTMRKIVMFIRIKDAIKMSVR